MFTLLFIGSLLNTACMGVPTSLHRSSGLSGRIIGGEEANITQFPYMVGLELAEELHCGASIIGVSWVVTAAHCIHKIIMNETQIRAGTSFRESGGTVHNVTYWISHPKYDYYSKDFDIAVLKVSPPFIFDNETQTIPLVSTEPSTGENGIITGWGINGLTLPLQLEFVTIPIVDHKECEKNYAHLLEVRNNMFCAGMDGRDSCTLDSGGPLAVAGKLAGIISWGNGCAEPGYPGVYTSIAKVKDFITYNTGIQ